MKEINGRLVLITGGLSGIGLALAEQLFAQCFCSHSVSVTKALTQPSPDRTAALNLPKARRIFGRRHR